MTTAALDTRAPGAFHLGLVPPASHAVCRAGLTLLLLGAGVSACGRQEAHPEEKGASCELPAGAGADGGGRRGRPRPTPPRDLPAGKESVWAYPLRPRIEPVPRRIRVVLGGVTVAETRSAVRLLENGHPPVYYVPRHHVRTDALVPAPGSSRCEYKGQAAYFHVRGGGREASRAAWSYPQPTPGYAAIAGHVAFYPRLMDACFVDDERVRPQPGRFYGGWITRDLVGPFVGDSGGPEE